MTKVTLFCSLAAIASVVWMPPAFALAQATRTCNVASVNLDIKGNRLMLRCDAPAACAGGASIVWFAINLKQDLERGKMALSLMTAAKLAGRPVNITFYSDDASNNAWDMGCNPADCRPIVRIDLL